MRAWTEENKGEVRRELLEVGVLKVERHKFLVQEVGGFGELDSFGDGTKSRVEFSLD